MKYNQMTIEKMVKRMSEPDFSGISKLSEETGITKQTLYVWKRKYVTNKESLVMKKQSSTTERNAVEKLNLLLESSKLEGEELGKWIRIQGLHSESLTIWKQELQLSLSNKEKTINNKLLENKRRIKELEDDLIRKEKALAEMTTLIVLKKKVEMLKLDGVR
jgi:transposase